MLISKTAKVNWNFFNRDYYISKGYIFTKMKEEFEVKIEDLSNGSSSDIECICDYCNETLITKSYARFIRERKTTDKDCCKNTECQNQKREESMYNKYGAKNARKLDYFNEKIKNTCLDTYGYKAPMGNEEVKDKYKNTCLEKFGVSHASKSELIKDKKKQTSLINFGVENLFSSPIIREKIEKTNIIKYGYKNPMQNEEIKEKSITNSAESRYKNSTVKYSKQQEYICNILDGKLNYPISRLNVDILLEDKIIVEYNGGGHDLIVKLNGMSEKEFKIKDQRRGSFLTSLGYKIITIICLKDNIPFDDTILKMISYSKRYFIDNHSWIKFDIDNSRVITSQFVKEYDYGELRKIKLDDTGQVINI